MTQFQQLSTGWMWVFSLPHNLPQIWNRFCLQVLWLLYYFKSPVCCYITLLLLSWLLFFLFVFQSKEQYEYVLFDLKNQIYCSVQFSSVSQLCPTLCNPMNRSTPGLPVHYQLPESTQTQVHWVNDAIQPSYSLSSLSPPALNLS